MENNRIIKQFYDKCAGKPVDPITQTAAVIDLDTNKNLDQILAEIKSKLTELSVVYQNIENFDLDAFKADLEAILNEYKDAFANTDFSLLIEKIDELINEHGEETDPVFTEWMASFGKLLQQEVADLSKRFKDKVEPIIRENWYDKTGYTSWYDANEDGEVNSTDVAVAINIKTGIDTLAHHPLADVDGDGEVTPDDVNLITRYIAGLLNDKLYIAKDGQSLAVHVINGDLSLLDEEGAATASQSEIDAVRREVLAINQPGYYISWQDSTKIYALNDRLEIVDKIDMNPYVLYYDIDNNRFIYATLKFKRGLRTVAIKSALEKIEGFLHSTPGVSNKSWGQKYYNVKTVNDTICWADANNDGVVDMADVDFIERVKAGLIPAGTPDPRDNRRLAGDVNNDGSVAGQDLTAIVNILKGLEDAADYSTTTTSKKIEVEKEDRFANSVFNGSQSLVLRTIFPKDLLVRDNQSQIIPLYNANDTTSITVDTIFESMSDVLLSPYAFQSNSTERRTLLNGYVEETLPSDFSALSGVGGYYSVSEEIPSGYYLHVINGRFVITAVKSAHEEGEVLETFDACTGVVYYLQDLHRFAYIDPADSQLKPLKLA